MIALRVPSDVDVSRLPQQLLRHADQAPSFPDVGLPIVQLGSHTPHYICVTVGVNHWA